MILENESKIPKNKAKYYNFRKKQNSKYYLLGSLESPFINLAFVTSFEDGHYILCSDTFMVISPGRVLSA